MRLRRIAPDQIVRESRASQFAASRHNPAKVARFGARRHVLTVGNSDDVRFYQLKDSCGFPTAEVYCININRGLGYCGVQAYNPADQEPDPTLGIFLQGEQVDEILGANALDRLTNRTIARRLIEAFQEVSC